uniref:WD repeat protein mio zinc-ribbon like domain-containing protein n=1 Tax=Plectus sambesii TaxID=2011161 RepID=A0A914WZF3_9BILA
MLSAYGRDVRWMPKNGDKFLVVSPDCLQLFATDAESGRPTVIAQHQIGPFLRCFDIHPIFEYLVACGYASGRVVLTSPCRDASEPATLAGREFSRSHSRQCQGLAWNPQQQYWLAGGFEKYNRTDYAVLIYDVWSRPASVMTAATVDAAWPDRHGLHKLSWVEGTTTGPQSVAARPLYELAQNETAYSLAWFTQQHRTLVAGLSHRYVRLFDLRDTSKYQQSLTTKSVYGLSVDPFNEHRFCCYVENTLEVYDLRLRNNNKPVFSVNTPNSAPIVKAQWDPVRHNVLTCLTKDSTIIQQYHLIQPANAAAENAEYTHMDRHVGVSFNAKKSHVQGRRTVASFEWHPFVENRLVAVSTFDDPDHLVVDTTVCEHVSVDWSPTGGLAASLGHNMMAFTDPKWPASEVDLSVVMHRRATNNYGQVAGANAFTSCVTLLEKDDAADDSLKWLWRWMERLSNLSRNDDWHYECRFPGVCSMMRARLSQNGTRLEHKQLPDQGLPSTRVYIAMERDRILRACGWGSLTGDRAEIDVVIDKLIEKGTSHPRAAAIALFCLRLKKAIEILTKASDADDEKHTHLRLVAMSLAGYQGTAAMWPELCAKLLPTLTDPYLRAMFVFLSCRKDADTQFEPLLQMSGLALQDRIAFASVHLADHPLIEFLDQTAAAVVQDGDLCGLLLTGIKPTEDCIRLLQNYVDRTGDVQTAALVLIHGGCMAPGSTAPAMLTVAEHPLTPSSTPALRNTSRSASSARLAEEGTGDATPGLNMVEAYLSLLNSWRMWHQRAVLESLVQGRTWTPGAQSADSTSSATTPTHHRIPSQVFLACTFCGKNVIIGRKVARPGQVGPDRARTNACCSCRKPLPRCALCRRHMGTHLPPESGKHLSTLQLIEIGSVR